MSFNTLLGTGSLLKFVEFSENPVLVELTKCYLSLLELHEKAKQSVKETNQARSEYTTSLEGRQHQRSPNLDNRHITYASQSLNQMFLRKPFYAAIKALFRALKVVKTSRIPYPDHLIVANNSVCAEWLLRNALCTFGRFTPYADAEQSFLHDFLSETLHDSWMNYLPLPEMAAISTANSFPLAEMCSLLVPCVLAIGSIQNRSSLIAVVNLERDGGQLIPESTITLLTAEFKLLGWNLEVQPGGKKLHISKI